jgi:hypothetical protein
LQGRRNGNKNLVRVQKLYKSLSHLSRRNGG